MGRGLPLFFPGGPQLPDVMAYMLLSAPDGYRGADTDAAAASLRGMCSRVRPRGPWVDAAGILVLEYRWARAWSEAVSQ